MAGLAIKATSLLSRAKRKGITGGKPRRISTALKFSEAGQGSSGGNIVQRVFRPLARFAGWAIKQILSGLTISVTAIFQWVVNGAMAIARFDWNKSDQAIRELQKNNNITMAAIWGSFVGQGFGWLTGIAVGAGIAYLVPVIGGASLAKMIASKAGTEALDELYYGLRGAISQTVKSLGTNATLSAYMQIRKLIKKAPKSFLVGIFGEQNAEFIQKQWGREGGPDLSLATQFEERLEAIESDTLRTFLESAAEEYWDGFMEAGFIVAQELDDAYAQLKRHEEVNGVGQERAVFLTPDKEAPQERIYLEGPEKLVKQQALTALSTHRMVYNRDMGQIVGMPAEDWYRAKPQRRKATIVFRSVPRPPFRLPNGDRPKEATYSIPDAKMGLSWADLKAFTQPYMWGEWRANANLDNGRQMAVYGASAQEAEITLKRLMRLSTANLVTLSVTQEKERNIKLKKHPTRMYPIYATLLIRTPSTDLTGRTDLSGNTWDERKERIPLWRDEEPEGINWS